MAGASRQTFCILQRLSTEMLRRNPAAFSPCNRGANSKHMVAVRGKGNTYITHTQISLCLRRAHAAASPSPSIPICNAARAMPTAQQVKCEGEKVLWERGVMGKGGTALRSGLQLCPWHLSVPPLGFLPLAPFKINTAARLWAMKLTPGWVPTSPL